MRTLIVTLLAATSLVACANVDRDADNGEGDLSRMGDLDAIGEPDEVDMVDATCREPDYTPGACEPGQQVDRSPATTNPHIDVPEVITYPEWPPSNGPHRPQWARWGEYSFLPAQRWVHNLEHGGVVFAYHPCAPAETIDIMRTYAQSVPDDERGPFRYILTPVPDLPTTMAVITWGHVYSAECALSREIAVFVNETYRMGPEDVGSDGPYSAGFIGR